MDAATTIAKDYACPCCGSMMPGRGDPVEIIKYLPLGGNERRICELLASNFGQWVPGPRLYGFVYNDRPDGGPLGASQCVSVSICHMRRRLAAVGLRIEGVGNRGRRMIWSAP